MSDSLLTVSSDTLIVVSGQGASPSLLEVVGTVALVTSALAAAVAAVVSAWSGLQQRRAQEEEKRWLKAEKKHFYYRAVVSEPALAAIKTYRERALVVLEGGAQRIVELHDANATSDEIHDRLESVSADYNRAHVQLGKTLRGLDEAWHETNLGDELAEALHALQDDISKNELSKLSHREASPEFSRVINIDLSEVVRIIQENDPVFEHQFGRADLNERDNS